MQLYKHILLLLISFIVIFVWMNSDLNNYSIPLIGFLIFIFLIATFRTKQKIDLGGPINLIILSGILILFIDSTGGIESSLFFLIYFLLFAASFIMHPKSVFIIAFSLTAIFWNQVFESNVSENIIKIASIYLLSPLAFFFGIQFKKNDKNDDIALKSKERTFDSIENIQNDAQNLIQSTKEKLTTDEFEKLEEIAEEPKDLKKEVENPKI